MFDEEPVDALNAASLTVLSGKVWHATSVANFEAIVADGFIRAVPPVNRHANSFCQYLGRLSLFDFRDAPNLVQAVERGDWTSFMNIVPDEMAVWLRIDTERVVVPTAENLLGEWNEARDSGRITGSRFTRIIANLETGYPGDVPTSAVVDVLLIDGQSPQDNESIRFDADAVAHVRAFRAAITAKERPDWWR